MLDGEALGLDEDGDPLKFQDSMSGGSVLRPFFFDVLHLGGDVAHRRAVARAQGGARRRRCRPSLRLPTIDTVRRDEADAFARDALAAGHEGVMVKALDSPYQAGRRGATWRKVKPVHTLDLVVLAAEWGHGRRTGWLSNLHLGARGADGSFVMVGKTFKGLTDELLRWQTAALQALAIGEPGVGLRPARPAGAGGRDRARRRAAQSPLPGRRGAAVRPGAPLPPRQAAAEADTIERVQSML